MMDVVQLCRLLRVICHIFFFNTNPPKCFTRILTLPDPSRGPSPSLSPNPNDYPHPTEGGPALCVRRCSQQSGYSGPNPNPNLTLTLTLTLTPQGLHRRSSFPSPLQKLSLSSFQLPTPNLICNPNPTPPPTLSVTPTLNLTLILTQPSQLFRGEQISPII